MKSNTIVLAVVILLVSAVIGATAYNEFGIKPTRQLQPNTTPDSSPDNKISPSKDVSSEYSIDYQTHPFLCDNVFQAISIADQANNLNQVYTTPPDFSPQYVRVKAEDQLPFFEIPADESYMLSLGRNNIDIIVSGLVINDDITYNFLSSQVADLTYNLLVSKDQYVSIKQDSSNNIIVSCLLITPFIENQLADLIEISTEFDYTPFDVMSIWESSDGAYTINKHLIHGSSGVGNWYIDAGNQWENVFTGQDLPPCHLFEEAEAGVGIECMRCIDPENTNPYENTCNLSEESTVQYASPE